METLRREHFNRWYNLIPYYLSIILFEIPFQVRVPSTGAEQKWWIFPQNKNNDNNDEPSWIFLAILYVFVCVRQLFLDRKLCCWWTGTFHHFHRNVSAGDNLGTSLGLLYRFNDANQGEFELSTSNRSTVTFIDWSSRAWMTANILNKKKTSKNSFFF